MRQSDFEKELKRAPTFEAAVKIALRRYRLEAKHAVCPSFWEQQATQARFVLSLIRRHADPDALLIALESARLCWYVQALEEGTGEAFAECLGF